MPGAVVPDAALSGDLVLRSTLRADAGIAVALRASAGRQPDDVAGLDAQLGGGIRLVADDGHPVPGIDEDAIRTGLDAPVRPDPRASASPPRVATWSTDASASAAATRCDGRTLSRTLPKRSMSSTSPVMRPRSTSGSARRTSVRSDSCSRRTQGGQVGPGRQVRRGRRKDVATMEDARDRLEDDIRRADGDGSPGTTVRPPRQRQDAVVRSHQLAPRLGFDGDRQPIGPDPRVDDREAHRISRCEPERLGQDEAAGANVMRGDPVGDVDDGRARRDAGDDRVTHAHELIPQAKVRNEDDRLAQLRCSPRKKDLAHGTSRCQSRR